MSGGVAGSNFSHEAAGFGGNDGGPPDVGQVILAIDPAGTMGDGFAKRLDHEFAALAAEPGVRLPGDQRLAERARTAEHGVVVPHELMSVLRRYAELGSPFGSPSPPGGAN